MIRAGEAGAIEPCQFMRLVARNRTQRRRRWRLAQPGPGRPVS
jgi:hypothetical protein